MANTSLTYLVDQARLGLGNAIAAEREHYSEIGVQLLVANQLGDFEWVHAVARSLREQPLGTWDGEGDEYWLRARGEDLDGTATVKAEDLRSNMRVKAEGAPAWSTIRSLTDDGLTIAAYLDWGRIEYRLDEEVEIPAVDVGIDGEAPEEVEDK